MATVNGAAAAILVDEPFDAPFVDPVDRTLVEAELGACREPGEI
jgi:hypothetical protein